MFVYFNDKYTSQTENTSNISTIWHIFVYKHPLPATCTMQSLTDVQRHHDTVVGRVRGQEEHRVLVQAQHATEHKLVEALEAPHLRLREGHTLADKVNRHGDLT